MVTHGKGEYAKTEIINNIINLMKTKLWLSVLIALLVGYVLGAVLGVPPTSSELGSGNVAKVSKFQKNTVNPELNAWQERLLADSTELGRTASSLLVLTSRMGEFDQLAGMSLSAADGISELEGAVSSLKAAAQMAANAKKAGQTAMESFDALISGTKTDAPAYDKAQNDMTLAFLMLERQVNSGKLFVEQTDAYLAKAGKKGNEALAAVRDLWQDYCALDAVMNSNNSDVEYWSKTEKALTGSELMGFLPEAVVNFCAPMVGLKPEAALNSFLTVDATIAAAYGANTLGVSQRLNVFEEALQDVCIRTLGSTALSADALSNVQGAAVLANGVPERRGLGVSASDNNLNLVPMVCSKEMTDKLAATIAGSDVIGQSFGGVICLNPAVLSQNFQANQKLAVGFSEDLGVAASARIANKEQTINFNFESLGLSVVQLEGFPKNMLGGFCAPIVGAYENTGLNAVEGALMAVQGGAVNAVFSGAMNAIEKGEGPVNSGGSFRDR